MIMPVGIYSSYNFYISIKRKLTGECLPEKVYYTISKNSVDIMDKSIDKPDFIRLHL